MRGEFTVLIEPGEKYFIGYSPEVPGANGQGASVEECRESVRQAIELIMLDRMEDAMKDLPMGTICEQVVVG